MGHLLAYGLLAWLVFIGLSKRGRWAWKTGLWTVGLVSTYGILLEFVQWAFFPHRFFEVWDMIANITGSIISYLLYLWWFSNKKSLQSD